MKRRLWLTIGWTALALGAAGVPLPLLPTTPFLLLAAFAFARASPRLHRRLLRHPRFGPPIRAWYREGAISGRAKAVAFVVLAVSLGVGVAVGLPAWAIALQGAAVAAVAVFLMTRPSPGSAAGRAGMGRRRGCDKTTPSIRQL